MRTGVGYGALRRGFLHKSGTMSRHHRVDFLDRTFESGGLATRTEGSFVVSQPWALSDFGEIDLQEGWWRFVCSGAASREGVDLRLRSPDDPLIVISGLSSDADRIYLRGRSPYRISLLVSPWPGVFQFDQLLLVKLNAAEEAALLVGGAMKVLTRDKPLQRIATITQRLRAGQSFGISSKRRIAPAVDPDVGIPPLRAASRAEPRSEARNGIVALAHPEQTLHARAFDLAQSLFERSPHLHAIYADACADNRNVLHTGWDSMIAVAGGFDGAPIFLRTDIAGPVSSCGAALLAVAGMHGDASIGRIALPLAVSAAGVAPSPGLPPSPQLSETPLVSVVIPTKLRIDLLEKCLTSLIARTDYPALEVVVVDNGASDPSFKSVIAAASEKLKVSVVEDHGAFNFSRLINAGVKKARGDLLLILNDDIEATQDDWMRRMVASAVQPDVGAVGARLLYPDGTIQHAGVTMGLGGPCGHLWKGLSPTQAQRNAHVVAPGQRMAVTGACLMVRRNAFEQVGGFDEAFAVAFNDIDFCLRLKQLGLKNIYRGDAPLVHHESQSRGADDIDVPRRLRLASETRVFLDRWNKLCGDDPFGSPAFDPTIERGVPHRSLLNACQANV